MPRSRFKANNQNYILSISANNRKVYCKCRECIYYVMRLFRLYGTLGEGKGDCGVAKVPGNDKKGILQIKGQKYMCTMVNLLSHSSTQDKEEKSASLF